MSAARFIVSGKVQGVWFRAATQEQARALGLSGYARNLADGRVEVLAAGDALALDTLTAWLRQGPPLAQVEDLERLPARDDEAGDAFLIG
ncbi:acylphosphatase [Lysobacter cavernae]|uniref:Acylphosphatase n=1 Tax=Lysobacter cavernae TaxID=1685901 RepID=A0ABV7RTL5_9GAMM